MIFVSFFQKKITFTHFILLCLDIISIFYKSAVTSFNTTGKPITYYILVLINIEILICCLGLEPDGGLHSEIEQK